MATRNISFTRGYTTDEMQRAYAMADALQARALRSRVPPPVGRGQVQPKMSPWEGVAQMGEALIAALVARNANKMMKDRQGKAEIANEQMLRNLAGPEPEGPRRIEDRAPMPDFGQPTGDPVPPLLDVETGRPMLTGKAAELAAAISGLDPIEANRVLSGAVLSRALTPPEYGERDLGDRVEVYDKRNGRTVQILPKGVSPDADMREQGAMTRFYGVSGDAALREKGQMTRWGGVSGDTAANIASRESEGALDRTNRVDVANIRAKDDTPGSTGMKASDSNAITSISARAFGGIYDPLSGNISGLKPSDLTNLNKVAARASTIFYESNGTIPHAVAVQQAMQELMGATPPNPPTPQTAPPAGPRPPLSSFNGQ